MGQTLLRAPPLQIAAMTLLVFLVVMGVRSQGLLESLELQAYDWAFRLRPHQQVKRPPITLVTITDQDIQALGIGPFPMR